MLNAKADHGRVSLEIATSKGHKLIAIIKKRLKKSETKSIFENCHPDSKGQRVKEFTRKLRGPSRKGRENVGAGHKRGTRWGELSKVQVSNGKKYLIGKEVGKQRATGQLNSS